MPKAPTYKTSAVHFDGAAPLFLSTGEITFNTVSQATINFMVPWNASIQRVYWSVRTLATVTDLLVQIGNSGTAAANYANYRLDASAAGQFVLEGSTVTTSGWTTIAVAAGAVFRITFNTGATAVVSATVVLNPNL